MKGSEENREEGEGGKGSAQRRENRGEKEGKYNQTDRGKQQWKNEMREVEEGELTTCKGQLESERGR